MTPLPRQLCTYCNQLLPQDSFTPSVRGKRGYYCKPCKQISNSQRDRRKLDESGTPVKPKMGRKRKTYAEKLANRAENGPGGASGGGSRVYWTGCPCEHISEPHKATEGLLELVGRAVGHYEGVYRGEGLPAREDLAVMFDTECTPCGTTFRTIALVDNGAITRVDRIELDPDGVNLGIYRLEIPDFNTRRVYAAPTEAQ